MGKVPFFPRVFVILVILAYFVGGYLFVGFMPHEWSFEHYIVIDKLCPVIPSFVIFYVLAYIFVLAPAFLFDDEKEFYWIAANYILLMSIAYLTFMLVPLEQNMDFVLGSDFFSSVVGFIHAGDTNFNNFPSLHVALSMFAFFVISRKNKTVGRYLFIMPVLIILSTMFIKQHLFVDLIGGAALALCVNWFYGRYAP